MQPKFPISAGLSKFAARVAGLALVLGFFAAPAAAYIVILKDGTQITTAEKYVRKGKEVILTMPNGVTTSYLASDIDFEKTDELNAGGKLSNAKILNTGNVRELERKNRPEEPKRQTFSDLLTSREKGLALPEPRRRQPTTGEDGDQVAVPLTGAGFTDLMELRRDPHKDSELVSQIVGCLTGQGNQVKVYKGSRENWPLVEMTAASEASVFKATKDAANCIVQVQQQLQALEGFELLVVTDAAVRAAQFSLTEDLANELLTGKMEAPSFFLRYVEF